MIFLHHQLSDLQTLLGGVTEWQSVGEDTLPEPYRSLLAHDRHMTVTLEEYWKGPVSVHVLHSEHDNSRYARRIYLSAGEDQRKVEYGAVILDLSACTAEVRREILDQKTPLGRTLIHHNILTHINCHEFARITPGQGMCKAYGLDSTEPLFGRHATISFNDQPAMALIEVMPAHLEAQA